MLKEKFLNKMVQQRIKELEEMIDSFPPTYDLVKKGLKAKLEVIRVDVEENYVLRDHSVTWGVEDFKNRVLHLQEVFPEKKYIFDETKFEESLEEMISNHDANYGITWETIDYYLLQDCLKSFDRDDYEDKLH